MKKKTFMYIDVDSLSQYKNSNIDFVYCTYLSDDESIVEQFGFVLVKQPNI